VLFRVRKRHDKVCYFIQKSHPIRDAIFVFGADEQIRTAYPAHSSARSRRIAAYAASWRFLSHWAFASLYPPQAALGSAPITKIGSSRDRKSNIQIYLKTEKQHPVWDAVLLFWS
jgi:hypothetical protein